MKEFLSLEDNRVSMKYFILLMLAAYVFSIAVRMIWVYQFYEVEGFYWNNEIMINTNDGYYYAEGARDILSGATQVNSTSPVNSLLSKLTAFLATVLPVSFESLILYMPTFIASLLVVPIMLILRLFMLDKVGFIAALLGAIAWSYYNRTMTGYYDTDLLVVILPTLFIWGVLFALHKEKSYYYIIAPIIALVAMNWHGGMIHIINGTFFLTLVYTIVYERYNRHYYQFLSVLVLALTTLSVFAKLFLMLIIVGIFYFFKDKLTDKVIIVITLLSAIIYLYFGGVNWVTGILNHVYVTRALHAEDISFSLHYYGVINTIRETGHIPFEIFANRISGHTIIFVFSLIGYMLLLVKYRLLILTLPMVVLGFFALQGGLRFTVFAVPFMAIGVAYVIFIISDFIKNMFVANMQKYAQYSFLLLATVAILYPNVIHAVNYKVPTVFNKDEVRVLDKLGEVSSVEDYVVAWWDYGYPIRYYSDVKTLIDGAQHSGGANFSVSFALLNNQVAAANMARLSVEYNEINFKEPCGTTVECMLKDGVIDHPNNILKTFSSRDLELPKKSRDIYFYLPNRMLGILPTVDLFSNLDLISGEQHRTPLFFVSKSFKENQTSVNLGRGVEIIKKDSNIKIGNQIAPINTFVITEYDKHGVFHKKEKKLSQNPNADVYVIYMKSYNQFLVLSKRLYESLYIQLFVLENSDKDLYEPIISSPYAKVYKLKI